MYDEKKIMDETEFEKELKKALKNSDARSSMKNNLTVLLDNFARESLETRKKRFEQMQEAERQETAEFECSLNNALKDKKLKDISLRAVLEALLKNKSKQTVATRKNVLRKNVLDNFARVHKIKISDPNLLPIP